MSVDRTAQGESARLSATRDQHVALAQRVRAERSLHVPPVVADDELRAGLDILGAWLAGA
jgi:hypothetical protein